MQVKPRQRFATAEDLRYALDAGQQRLERDLNLEQHRRPEIGHPLGIAHELKRVAETLFRVQQDRAPRDRLSPKPQRLGEIAPPRRPAGLLPPPFKVSPALRELAQSQADDAFAPP